MIKDKMTEQEYWLDVYSSYKKDRKSKKFYSDLNEEQLKYLCQCRFEELLQWD